MLLWKKICITFFVTIEHVCEISTYKLVAHGLSSWHHQREIRPPFRQHSRHCPRNYLAGCKLHILKNSVDAFAGYFWTWIWLLRSWVREWLLKFDCNECCSRCSQTISCGKSGSRSMNVNLSIISEYVVYQYKQLDGQKSKESIIFRFIFLKII